MGETNSKGKKEGKKGEKHSKKVSKAHKEGKEKLRHDPNDDIAKYYEVTDKVLGLGNFSQVKMGIDKESGEQVAIKIVDKSSVKHKPEMLTNEVDILLQVDHPNIIKLLDLFNCDKYLYLVMELVTGGELFDRIVEREQYSERDAKEVMKQLFSSIDYIHSKGIVHRDLKPENLLLEDDDNDTKIKMTDFGLSKIYSQEFMMSTACGTPGYVAPEILNCGGYDPAVDMWSAGVIMYILLCGYPPFYSENDAQLFESILEANYHFHSPYWDDVSTEAKDLIKKLLVVDPKDRLTAKQALEAAWFKTNTENSSNPLPKDMKDKLVRHNTERKDKSRTNITAKPAKK